jgi:antitoxin component of MazEF toxin-antitoxin module
LIDDQLEGRCSVPLRILTEIARPILMGILEAYGYAATIKGAKDLLARDEDLRREVVRMAMFDRVVLLASPEAGKPGFVATAVEIGSDPVVRVPHAVAAWLGLEDGDQISVHLPISDAAQREAKDLAAGTLEAPAIEDAPSWVRDVARAGDVAATLADRAAARAVDPCLWPPAAMLVGGYKVEGPPPPAIEIGPPPPRAEPKPPPARLMHALADLEISTRTLKRLEDAGIMTLLHLVQRTDSELLKIKGFSRASLKEVKDLLAAMDLSLGMRV